MPFQRFHDNIAPDESLTYEIKPNADRAITKHRATLCFLEPTNLDRAGKGMV